MPTLKDIRNYRDPPPKKGFLAWLKQVFGAKVTISVDPPQYTSSLDLTLSETQVKTQLLVNGTIKPEAAAWITPILNDCIKNGYGIDYTSREIRKHGTLLTKDELKTCGLRGNTKITREYMESLTQKGLQDPKEAIFYVCHRLILNLYSQSHIQRATKLENFGIKTCLKMYKDSTACNAAKTIMDKTFTPDNCPIFPLEGCDSKLCRCGVFGTVTPTFLEAQP